MFVIFKMSEMKKRAGKQTTTSKQRQKGKRENEINVRNRTLKIIYFTQSHINITLSSSIHYILNKRAHHTLLSIDTPLTKNEKRKKLWNNKKGAAEILFLSGAHR